MRCFVAAVMAAVFCFVGSVEAGRYRGPRVSPVAWCGVSCLPASASSSTVTRSVTRSQSTECDGSTCRQRTVSVSSSTSGHPPQANSQQPSLQQPSLAQWKADQLAARGQLVHLGGSFGGGSAEGIGYGSTAEQATRSCCYWGQRTPIDIGVAQGAIGYYAVVLYR